MKIRQLVLLFSLLFLLSLLCDLPIANYIHCHSFKELRTLCRFISCGIAPLLHLILWPTLLLAFWKIVKIRNALLLVNFNLFGVNTLVTFFKVLIGRPRPKLYYSEGIYLPSILSLSGNFHSFPSRHAATIAGVLGYFCLRYPKYARPSICLLFVFTLARVGLNSHFLSDIVAGNLLGLSVAFASYRLYNLFFLEKIHEPQN